MNTEISVLLGCYLSSHRNLSYDSVELVVLPGHCPDMTGAIAVARLYNPNVSTILVRDERKEPVCLYYKDRDDVWRHCNPTKKFYNSAVLFKEALGLEE